MSYQGHGNRKPLLGDDIHEPTKPSANDHLINTIVYSDLREPDHVAAAERPLSSKRALWGWLILCFSTGPTASMINSYATASIQSAANRVGHIPGTNKPCAHRGAIKCVVKLGAGEVDYLSYLMYLQAISRATEGVLCILVSGLADYSNNRKTIMMASIYLFGALALPFAALTDNSYAHLNTLASLYVISITISSIYKVLEASYIPIFMRSVGWSKHPEPLRDHVQSEDDDSSRNRWRKGSRVSVLGLLAGNLGGILALLIGVIITYTRGSYVTEGYFNFLLAITIGGCLTILCAVAGHIMLPSIPGAQRPKDKMAFLLPIRTWLKIVGSIRQYPNAFKLCIGWVLWNTAYSNFIGLLGALFLETSGIKRGSNVYTVYTFMMILFACIGSLGWLLGFHKSKLHIKSWAYIFLAVNATCLFWGCLGIAKIPIGYKHQAEFWVADALFMSTSSALRSLNRVMYASLIPSGSEAAFFGLEITLDLATGWINPLVQGVIQNRTHNLRFPMIPNLVLMLVSICLYVWTDVDQGMRDADKTLVSDN
ncbi:hypothetical protein MY4824_003965 [Beauveria thailandica]